MREKGEFAYRNRNAGGFRNNGQMRWCVEKWGMEVETGDDVDVEKAG